MEKKQRPRYEGQIPSSFVDYLVKHWPGFADLPGAHQLELGRMILQTPTHHQAHSHYPDHGFKEAAKLAEVFGRGGFNRINGRLGLFDIVKDEQGRDKYSYRKGYTKPYKLSEELMALLDRYLDGGKYRRVILKNLNGEVTPAPENALSSRRKATVGKDRKPTTPQPRVGFSTPVVAAAVPINRRRLMAIVKECERMLLAIKIGRYQPSVLHPHPDEKRVQSLMREAKMVLRYAHNANPGLEDALGHRYEQSASGRLYAKETNLQTTHRVIRQAALYGCYDYDIENCHYDILAQMAAKPRYQCGAIREYLDNKKKTRGLIADEFGLTIDQAKECLIALIYGARFSLRIDEHMDPEDAIAKTVGDIEVARQLFEHPLFVALKDDIAGARTAVLKSWPVSRQGSIKNDMGLPLRLEGTKAPQQLAHLLQGVEAKALDAMLQEVYRQSAGKRWVLVIQHDGFTSGHLLDEGRLETAVRDATGYELAVSTDGMLTPDLSAGVAKKGNAIIKERRLYQLDSGAPPSENKG